VKPVEHHHPDTPPRDDPQVTTALAVWDALNDDERREVFASLYRAVLAHQRTSHIDHLVRFAESVDGMVRLESTTDLRQILRARRE
jgi:hypothetical protein